MAKKVEKLVPDTSVIVQGVVSEQIRKKELQVDEIIIHEAVLAELEHQANEGHASGLIGLDEVKRLQELKIPVRFAGLRPHVNEIRHAKLGEIDASIRQLAFDEGAMLMTADKVQARVAEAHGVAVLFMPQKEYSPQKIKLETYFDEKTMSVHLREGVLPMAKRGHPGEWEFVSVGKSLLSATDIKDISREIIEEAGSRHDGFLEIQREGSTIVQLGRYRIVIVRPPFSDGWEITAVRPVRKLKLPDYQLSEKLYARVAKQAEGILIAGAPGMGKSTFAQALAENYAEQGKIVKTVEAPRDMVLPETITQLAISRGSPEEVHDVLLLSRPDYTLFDEMRNVRDFLLYTDMRLAGVGMVGVVHGTNPMDSIQRFIGKIELGVIPHVIDTVVFIKNGVVDTVLSIEMMVKVPAGMTEADLARPTIVVSDFETGKPVAEIYTYGEETVVVPVSEQASTGARALAAKQVERVFHKYSEDVGVDVVSDNKVVVYVPAKYIPLVIGREGKTIQALEAELGMSIDVQELTSRPKKSHGNAVKYDVAQTSKHLEFLIGDTFSGTDVDILVNGEYLATFAVSKKGVVRIKKANKLGKVLVDALKHGDQISFVKA